MNEIATTEENIESKIYKIRGVQVMFDYDLAKLYHCKNGAKEVNQAVSRNVNKFPKRYSWVLTNEELIDLRSQFVTTNISTKSRTNPRVFTEQGVAMLATILKTPVATQISIKIMDTFVAMRQFLSQNFLEQNHYKNMLLEDHNKIALLESTLDKLSEHQKVNSIFFEGQIFDAYVFFLDLLNRAKQEIIIIDNYAGTELFKIIKNIKIKIIIISKNIDEELIKKYQQQYQNIEIKINNSFHDRFIIIDKTTLYHCGASFKDLGVKCFAINLIDDKTIVNEIINTIYHN